MTRHRNPALALVAAAAVLLGACAGPDRAAAPVAGTRLGLLGGGTPGYLQCDAYAAGTVSGLISPLTGGVVSLGDVSIALPVGAVLEPTTITLTVPDSPYAEVRIRANGAEHFQFLRTAVVTMSYRGCGGGLLDLTPYTVWHVDEATRAPIAQMLTVDNKLTKSVTFVTNHLSGYIIANRSGVQPDTTGDGEE